MEKTPQKVRKVTFKCPSYHVWKVGGANQEFFAFPPKKKTGEKRESGGGHARVSVKTFRTPLPRGCCLVAGTLDRSENMSFGHSEVSFNHSCLKVPVHSASRRPAPKYERSLSVKSSQSPLDREKRKYPSSDLYVSSVKKYLDFYESIPDYSELHHLSNEEFYSRLKSLKITQKRLCSESGIWSSFDEGVSSGKFNYEGVGCLQKAGESGSSKEVTSGVCGYAKCTPDKDYCLLSELYEKKNSKKGEDASTGVKQPPPKINIISDYENASDLYEPECKKHSDYEADQESSTLQVGEAPTRGGSGKLEGGEEECLWGSCSRRSRSLPVSPACECECAGLCNGFTEFAFRNEGRLSDSKGQQSLQTKTKKLHSRPIPLTSRIPLFDKIMMEKEARRRIIHDLYSEELRSLVKPFSFTKREEEKERLRMISSNPELTSLNPPVVRFKAKPIPKNLFSNYAYERMKEDEFYRALKRRVRAEEMLKSSSLPPSMALRERKSRSKSLDFLDCRCLRRSLVKHCGYRRACSDMKGEEFEEDVKGGSCQKRKSRPAWMGSSRRINSATDSSTEISPYESILNPGRKRKERPRSAFHCSRNNLASVLRIETARKRLEKEMEEKLRENRLKDQARFKAHLARKNPAWRALRYDKNEDLALRMAARRQEERLKKESHQRLMESIYGRVYSMPPLFHKERFFNGKHFVCSEEKDPIIFPSNNPVEKTGKEVTESAVLGGNFRSRESSELTTTCEKNERKAYESDDTANET